MQQLLTNMTLKVDKLTPKINIRKTSVSPLKWHHLQNILICQLLTNMTSKVDKSTPKINIWKTSVSPLKWHHLQNIRICQLLTNMTPKVDKLTPKINIRKTSVSPLKWHHLVHGGDQGICGYRDTATYDTCRRMTTLVGICTRYRYYINQIQYIDSIQSNW